MNFKPSQLENTLKNIGTNIKCIVLFGTNEGAIIDLQKKCAEAVCGSTQDAFNYVQLDMDSISKDGGEVYAEFHAQSLMGGRRAIVVKNADNNLTALLKSMLPETKSENVLILSSLSLNTRSSLITWSKDREDIIICGCYDDREEDLGVVAQNMLKEKGLNIDVSTLQLLCSRLSPDRKLSQSEIDKLAVYMGNRQDITAKDVKAAVSDVAGANIEDLCYFVAEGSIQKACNMFERLLKEGQESATLIRQIAYHYAKLLQCVAQIDNSQTIDEAISAIRPPLMFYRKNSFKQQLQIWNKERLLRIMKSLYDTEKDCKSTGFPAEQCAAYFVLRLSDAANKLRQKN